VDTIDTSGQPHTVEYLEELSKPAIPCKELRCAVTDNAGNKNKIKKLLEHRNELNLVTYTNEGNNNFSKKVFNGLFLTTGCNNCECSVINPLLHNNI